MIDTTQIQYSAFDQEAVCVRLFHPRPEMPEPGGTTENYTELLIPTEMNIRIGGRFYSARDNHYAPTILYFHGNGEIVADYAEIAPLYTHLGLNFLPVDYRGYGRSTGISTVTGMMRDCHFILDYVLGWLSKNGYQSPLIVMGRSLGSASAIELASTYPEEIAALIIESGFAHTIPLMRVLGMDVEKLGLRETGGMSSIEKIKRVKKPLLIIHAEFDHIIPVSEGKALYEAAPSGDKRFLEIKDADHNSIFYYGMSRYLEAIEELAFGLHPSA